MPMMRVLLVHPPIFDFTAYGFWLRPYGLARVAGDLPADARVEAFDFLALDRPDATGRGRLPEQIIPRPAAFADIPRRYRRFGRARAEFQAFLRLREFDVVLVQTTMTYWYLGVAEVIEDVRALAPAARIVLGGPYATICPAHARTLGADLVVAGSDLSPLWSFLGVAPRHGLPRWDCFPGAVGVIKLTDGCPFRCSYCAVPQTTPTFRLRPVADGLAEARHLARLGVHQVVFYDDALLHRADQGLMPFLAGVVQERLPLTFHTPNALNARFLTPELAEGMVRAGVSSFFLGFESRSYEWQRRTGGKVQDAEFAEAVRGLRAAGAAAITAYVIAGHPLDDAQAVEESLHFAHAQGARVMLSEFSPIPGTPDGDACAQWVDLSEPLHHNKTAFAIRRLGSQRLDRWKELCRALNRRAQPAAGRA